VTLLPSSNAFEHVVLASLRAKQLMRGCTPKLPAAHKTTTTARLEVSAGMVVKLETPGPESNS
jgi:DNA-directed RNA polymerase subunit K/omega